MWSGGNKTKLQTIRNLLVAQVLILCVRYVVPSESFLHGSNCTL